MFDLSDFLKDILSSLIGPPGSGRDDEQSRRRQWTGIILLAIVMGSLLLWMHMNSMAALVLGMVFAFWLIAYIIVQSLRNHDSK